MIHKISSLPTSIHTSQDCTGESSTSAGSAAAAFDDDDVVFVKVPAKPNQVPPSQGQVLDDGIEVLVGIEQLPHTRSDCIKHQFSKTEAAQYNSPTVPLSELVNAKHCDKCYCYVCDVLASQCVEWRTHCHGE